MAVAESLGEFDRNDYATFRATFADVDGGVGVATAVTWKIRQGGYTGTVVTVSSPNGAITNVSANVWAYRVQLTTVGRVFVECEATSGLSAVVAGFATVRPSVFD